ncbi:autotransporter domain-containing protein [Microvirga sp. M2]|uniref:autotransporter outer membrane beta-barrel domain-containing protein n=1 Tax=Microvirga sp. M2 TaxID=3073270 RepID=UPI0039C02648
MSQSFHYLVEPGLKLSTLRFWPKGPSSRLTALLASASTATLVLLIGMPQSVTAQAANEVIQGPTPVTVPGTHSPPWDIGKPLMVGNTQDGTLIIEAGGKVTGTTARLGSDNNVTGTVIVRDLNSEWTNTGTLNIGVGGWTTAGGIGFLNILNQGTVSNANGQIGVEGLAKGTVTVSDPGSKWTNTHLVVGYFGTGILNIENGGQVESSTSEIGSIIGSSGTVTVSGSGSQWTNTSYLVVGSAYDPGETDHTGGTGSLTIADGGTVNAETTWVALYASAQGTVTLSGTDGARGMLTTGRIRKGVGSARLDLDGGILRATADQADYLAGFAPGDVVIGHGGAFVDSNGYSIGVASALGGAGGLTKMGAGILTLSGTNTYTGGTSLSGGVLAVSADANLGHTAGPLNFDGGTLRFGSAFNLAATRAIVLNSGGGTFDTNGFDSTISQNITGDGSLTKAGAGALTLSGTNTYTGGTRVSGGTLVIGAPDALPSGPVTFGGGVLRFAYTGSLDRPITVGSGGFTADTSGNTQTMSAPLTGSGPFTKSGSGSLNLTGNSPLTGPTSVQAGRLAVNGSLADSIVTVQTGATLGGNGTIGGLIVQNGGFAAPGNSIGRLSVAGNVRFTSGSVYEVEVNAAGQADRIDASGAATLGGGTVQVLAEQGIYLPQTTYTILSAGGGVSGRFAAVTSNLAFLTPTLDYGNRDVTLTLARSTDPAREPSAFNTAAITANQFRTADAVEALGEGNRVFDTVLGQSVAGARQAFDALSGEAHASAVTVAMDDVGIVRDTILSRLRQPWAPLPQDNVTAAYAADRPDQRLQPAVSSPALDPYGFTFWGTGFGSWGKVRSNGNAAGLDTSTGGFILGAETRIDETYRIGVAGGFMSTSFDIDGRLSSGANESVFGSLYGAAQWDAINVRLGMLYAHHDVDVNRTISFPGFSDRASASYDGSTLMAFGEVGYALDLGRVKLEPFVGASVMRVHMDDFREGGGPAALAGYGHSYELGTTTLGIRAETQLGTDLPLTVRGLMGWRHAFGDVNPAALLAFLEGVSAFEVSGIPIDRNAFVAEAGLDWQISPDMTLGVSYAGQMGSRAQEHAVKGNFTWRFATR